ncbi:MAG: hypothetical protein LBN08_06810 [Lactobacillales bacterium]|jgi:hypothetical protein|nr:hypothetical protein [Lactobacillales bacterium]
MLNKIENAAFAAKMAVKNFFADEEGDTNFVSIIIVVAIVGLLMIVFKDQVSHIVKSFQESVGKITDGMDSGFGQADS